MNRFLQLFGTLKSLSLSAPVTIPWKTGTFACLKILRDRCFSRVNGSLGSPSVNPVITVRRSCALVWAPWLLALSLPAADELALGVRTTEPLPPVEQRAKFQLPPGFEIQLVAAEPDINKPMNLAFDATGRLWVTTSIEYPWAAPTNRVGRDRLMIFEDFGPDGRARKVTQFADGLNIPIGVYPFRTDDRHWKAIVWSIPHIWLLEDTDGNGQADRRTPLYGPFDHTRDTHGNQASFRRGFDGWLYATHGFNNDSHVTARDGSHVDLNSGNTYRIRLDGSRIEHHTHGQVNPFGLTWDARGNLYSSDCHSAPLYQLLAGGWYPSFGKPDDGLGFAPVMLEHAHGSTAIDGALYYTDNLWPAEFQDTLFIGNVMTSRLNRDKVTFVGSTPKANEQPDFVTTSDPWFRPVDNTLGPDGALYIADFYNRIIGHYEVPLTHPGRDRERGRIWRVIYRGEDGTARLRPPALPQDAAGLIAELGSPSLTRRMLATSELQDRFGASIRPAVAAAAQSPQNAEQRVQALWLLQRLNSGTDATGAALADPNALVRTHAFRLLTEQAQPTPRSLELARAAAANDPDALVQRCAVEALGQHPQKENLPVLLQLRSRVPAGDTHLLYVVRKAIRDQLNQPNLFAAVLAEKWSDADRLAFLDVAVSVRSAAAAAFLVSQLDSLSANTTPTAAAALQHAARYATEAEVPQLASRIRAKYAGDLATQLTLFKSLDQGLRQRGSALPPAFQDWGRELLTQLLSPSSLTGWRFLPLPGQPANDPWDFQIRKLANGQEARVLSSIARGEQLTGILRSPEFKVGPEITFWLCGHDGYPDQPAAHRNVIRLRAAQSDQILFEAFAPRNDVAQLVRWNTAPLGGIPVVLELTDADTGDAYAWIALGSLTGAPDLPAFAPRGRTERLILAAELAGRIGIGPESPVYPRLVEIMQDKSADVTARAAALRVVVPALRAEADYLADPQIPLIWRERAAEAAIEGRTQREFLQAVWKEAPQRVQIRTARAFTGQPHSVKEFALGVERGEVPPGLLRDKGLRDALLAQADPATQEKLKKAIAALPPGDDSRAQLLAERRSGYEGTQANAELGRKLFEQNCAACHQLNGQGGLVGPQLTGIGNRGVERLCEDILDPNQNVDHAFRQTVVTLKNGDVMAGLFRREDGSVLVFADATGKEFNVPKADVAERTESEQSLMPDNFGESLPPADFNQLLAFLLSQR